MSDREFPCGCVVKLYALSGMVELEPCAEHASKTWIDVRVRRQ